MNIQQIAIKNIRSHTDTVVNLSASTTVITGKNGAGKTSILEAVYIALRGASFKGSDSDILRYEAPWYRIDLRLDDDIVRSVTYDPSKQSGKKQFMIHDKKTYRLAARDKQPVVLFEPEDLRLLHGSPARRRDFIDHFITQIDPTYSTVLRKYDRALKQRNSLLKSEKAKAEDLFVWNVALSEYGATIIEERTYAVERINKELDSYYHRLAHTDDTVAAHYSNTLIDQPAQKLLRELERSIDYDKAVKYTSIGPHRHDIIFHFNGHPALSVASRGEVRSIILALKRVEATIIEELTGQKPIILLDDVFSELDADRQEHLANDLYESQVIITTTHALSTKFATIEL